MAEAKKMKFCVIPNILPAEIIEKILTLLSLKDIYKARLICRRWKEIIEKGIILKKSCGRIPEIFQLDNSCTIIAGGNEIYKAKYIVSESVSGTRTVRIFPMDIINGEQRTKQLPNLSKEICDSSMVFHNGLVLLCGGTQNYQNCLQLDQGIWKKHSTLNEIRVGHSAVATQTATFIFGGFYPNLNARMTYEYLPKDSTTWLKGRTEIPGGFYFGSAIAVKSEQEIWLIGGTGTQKRILSFNVTHHTYQELPLQLNVGRYKHRCAVIPNTNKIMITGGMDSYNGYLYSAEIIDIDDGNVTLAAPLNNRRSSHGMGVVHINGENKLIVFGGQDKFNHYMQVKLDSVEIYNTQSNEWETTNIKLQDCKSRFGFVTIPLRDVIAKCIE